MTAALPEWARPVRRSDDIGILAWQAIGDGPHVPPDFTALVPLVDAVRALYGDGRAQTLQATISRCIEMLHPNAVANQRNVQNTVQRICARLRSAVVQYLYDTASVASVFSHLLEIATQPVAPLETAAQQVETVRLPIRFGYGVGDRIDMPDGRAGVIVTPRGPDGRAGVMPIENSGEDGPSSPMERYPEVSDDSGD